MTNWEFSLDCARKLDENDKLSTYRDRFFIPNFSGRESLYFTGNSLGLQPKNENLAQLFKATTSYTHWVSCFIIKKRKISDF